MFITVWGIDNMKEQRINLNSTQTADATLGVIEQPSNRFVDLGIVTPTQNEDLDLANKFSQAVDIYGKEKKAEAIVNEKLLAKKQKELNAEQKRLGDFNAIVALRDYEKELSEVVGEDGLPLTNEQKEVIAKDWFIAQVDANNNSNKTPAQKESFYNKLSSGYSVFAGKLSGRNYKDKKAIGKNLINNYLDAGLINPNTTEGERELRKLQRKYGLTEGETGEATRASLDNRIKIATNNFEASIKDYEDQKEGMIAKCISEGGSNSNCTKSVDKTIAHPREALFSMINEARQYTGFGSGGKSKLLASKAWVEYENIKVKLKEIENLIGFKKDVEKNPNTSISSYPAEHQKDLLEHQKELANNYLATGDIKKYNDILTANSGTKEYRNKLASGFKVMVNSVLSNILSNDKFDAKSFQSLIDVSNNDSLVEMQNIINGNEIVSAMVTMKNSGFDEGQILEMAKGWKDINIDNSNMKAVMGDEWQDELRKQSLDSGLFITPQQVTVLKKMGISSSGIDGWEDIISNFVSSQVSDVGAGKTEGLKFNNGIKLPNTLITEANAIDKNIDIASLLFYSINNNDAYKNIFETLDVDLSSSDVVMRQTGGGSFNLVIGDKDIGINISRLDILSMVDGYHNYIEKQKQLAEVEASIDRNSGGSTGILDAVDKVVEAITASPKVRANDILIKKVVEDKKSVAVSSKKHKDVLLTVDEKKHYSTLSPEYKDVYLETVKKRVNYGSRVKRKAGIKPTNPAALNSAESLNGWWATMFLNIFN